MFMLALIVGAAPAVTRTAEAQGVSTQGATTAQHATRAPRLVIRNATIVDGNGTPARGPAAGTRASGATARSSPNG